jgi:uncharacterized protein
MASARPRPRQVPHRRPRRSESELTEVASDQLKESRYEMNRFMGLFSRLLNRLTPRLEPTQTIFWEASNLTRQTVLATRLEVAGKSGSRRKGLLGRSHLSREEGLWIVPCEAVHTFGMQFPIDLVFLDRKNRVKRLRRSVPPWRLSACFTAHSVLELAQGTIRDTQTKPGDTLGFRRLV